ncbi:hypothetical protein [Novosphingobium sp.]|uniref:hypothetical protein n=1 Tax=Novosphingobium sp. TaxID=1874826 RepID=UPI002611AC17|nr:hypothetical protein [Novosphingobium sp.]
MQVIDNTAEPVYGQSEDIALRADVTGYGNAPKAANVIGVEDRHYVDSVLAMDPIADVPGTSVFPEGRKLSRPTLASLPPEMRAGVQAKLQAFPPEARAAQESSLVEAAIRAKLPALRIQTGLGESALPYHREMALIAREVRDLGREFDRVTAELTEVQSYGMETDPVTGQARPKEVLRVQGTRRKALEDRQQDLLRNMRVLEGNGSGNGIEANRRLAEAMAETVALLKERDRQVSEHREAEALGVQMARTARIEAKARQFARRDTGNL